MNPIRPFATLALCTLIFVSNAACQHDPNDQLLDDVWELVAAHHYDQDLHGLDWPALRDSYSSRLVEADSRAEAITLIDQMLQELGDSHCAVGDLENLAQASSPYLFGKGSSGLDIRIVEQQVLVTRVDANSPADDAGIRPGFVLIAIDDEPIDHIVINAQLRPPFTDANNRFHQTQAVLWRLYGAPGTAVRVEFLDESNDTHLAEIVRASRANAVELTQLLPEVFLSYGSKELAHGIAYVTFNAFQPDRPRSILQAVDLFADEAPLIIDLRGNNGGSAAATLALLGRFVSNRKLAFTRQARGSSEPVYIEPGDHIHSGPVAILVDEMSISAAENFAGIMQHTGRAKVFGAPTPGQLLWGEGFTIREDVISVIPTATLVYPDGVELEGKGVQPDRPVLLNRFDLLQGKDNQLQAAVDFLLGVGVVEF